MSTLATADLASDSDNDGDYVAPSAKTSRRRPGKSASKIKEISRGDGSGESSAEESDSGSGLSDDENAGGEGEGEDGRKAKRVKMEDRAKEEEEDRRRKAAEEAFAAFGSGAPEVTANEIDADGVKKEEEQQQKNMMMIEVERKRKFAGEIIVETVSLPSDHPEAIIYLTGLSNSPKNDQTSAANQPVIPSSEQTQSDPDKPSIAGSSSSIPATTSAVSAQSPTKPGIKGPIRRKPRQTLEQLSAGLTSGKKMTTLEKSQMDWKKHVASSAQVSDELDSNRRSGGYLEKKDFLDRVGDRRNETYEKNGSRR